MPTLNTAVTARRTRDLETAAVASVPRGPEALETPRAAPGFQARSAFGRAVGYRVSTSVDRMGMPLPESDTMRPPETVAVPPDAHVWPTLSSTRTCSVVPDAKP